MRRDGHGVGLTTSLFTERGGPHRTGARACLCAEVTSTPGVGGPALATLAGVGGTGLAKLQVEVGATSAGNTVARLPSTELLPELPIGAASAGHNVAWLPSTDPLQHLTAA
mmetsp:Transcript_90516/g.156955  ORF Transcript_90516/g.156955 Transcript_90516/m.156955 type:complete len:111 (-) Transcript_90516:1604-1936(-)